MKGVHNKQWFKPLIMPVQTKRLCSYVSFTNNVWRYPVFQTLYIHAHTQIIKINNTNKNNNKHYKQIQSEKQKFLPEFLPTKAAAI